MRPRIPVKINRTGNTEALVDSGAYRTVVASELTEQLKLAVTHSNLTSLRALGGHVVPTEGCVDLNVRFQDSIVDLKEVPVVRNASHALILGQDWIAAVGEVRITHTGVSGFNIEVGRKEESDGAEQPGVSEVELGEPSEVSSTGLGAIAPPIVGNVGPKCNRDTAPQAEEKQTPFAEFNPPLCEFESYRRLRVTTNTRAKGEALTYVNVQASEKFDGSVIVPRVVGARKGREWVIPSCLLHFTEGRAQVPLLNLS